MCKEVKVCQSSAQLDEEQIILYYYTALRHAGIILPAQ
jgi:hypothetical protein